MEENKEYEFFKKNETDKIWWVREVNSTNDLLFFSFDKEKTYDLFNDYPKNMTPEEVEIFDKENEYWAKYFEDRKKSSE